MKRTAITLLDEKICILFIRGFRGLFFSNLTYCRSKKVKKNATLHITGCLCVKKTLTVPKIGLTDFQLILNQKNYESKKIAIDTEK